MPLVDYLVARDDLPPRSGLAYDYLLAGDGVYLVAEHDLLVVRVPIAHCTVRGLLPICSACVLKHGRLPALLWEQIVAIARVGALYEREILAAVTWDDTFGYRVEVPPQIVSLDNVLYQRIPSTVLEIHSHHRYPAFFSPTDDADEQRLGLFGVLGRLDTDQPEVALRVGAYGCTMAIPWKTVFDGDRGGFRDASFDTSEEDGSTVGVSD